MEHEREIAQAGHTADWLTGYEAALADAIAIVDAMGGDGLASFNSPVLVRLRTRLKGLIATALPRAA